MTDATPQPDRINLPDHTAPKRPRVWTPERRAEAWERLLQHIADGGSLDAFCALTDTPSKPTVFEWIRSDPQLANDYARAREVQGDSYADKVADAAQQVLDGKLDAQAGRTAIDALKWLAAKRKPKVYGDRIDANVNLNGNVQVGWVIDLSPSGPVIEGEGATVIEGRTPADE
ncbi:hypothetical protein FBZ85_101468 [Azospirillum brasilense]|nr:hypothetical protein FBZ85_101468 [Azospirillum brasilense]